MMRRTGMAGDRFLRAAALAVGGALVEPSRPTPRDGARVVRIPSPPPLPPSPTAVASPVRNPEPFGARALNEDEWEDVGGKEVVESEEDRGVFGRHPSIEEVEGAVSGLQQIYLPVTFTDVLDNVNPFYLEHNKTPDADVSSLTSSRISSVGVPTESESDWVEPTLHLYSVNPNLMMQHQNIYDAFRLLQLNPTIQRMVVSLSSDREVWDAVMKNEVVQEIKNSYRGDAVDDKKPDDNISAAGLLQRILGSTHARIMEFFAKIVKTVNELFRPRESGTSDIIDAVRSSFMLSVIVLLVVVATRIRKE